MRPGRKSIRSLAFVLLLAACASTPPHPEPGQAGKDVVWLPSPAPLVEKMLDLARVTREDTVVDLGSGDGRTVIAAAKRGARARGIEYDAGLVSLARRNAAEAGVQASFEQADIFKADFSSATVVTLFLLTDLNLKLRPRLLDMKPGTRIVSNTFGMGEWRPDAEVTTGCGAFCTAHLWIVPAKIDGYWQSSEGELAFTQEFQRVFGTLKSGGRTLTMLDGRLRADRLSFDLPDAEYEGTVQDGRIEGRITRGAEVLPWSATRKPL